MKNQVQKQNNKAPNKENVNNTKQEKLKEISSLMHREAYSGPIPHYELMQGYAKIDPTFPDRIFKLTEDNLNHQYAHEKSMDRLQFLGWNSATFITISTLFCGAYLLMHDKNLGGLSCLVGSALPSILIFFKTKNNKNN